MLIMLNMVLISLIGCNDIFTINSPYQLILCIFFCSENAIYACYFCCILMYIRLLLSWKPEQTVPKGAV